MAGEVTLVDLVKKFAEVTAVDGVNLEMPSGEFFSMLGPSGCGKTTTLRMIAGFEQPTEGRILLDGNDMAFTPPHKRNVNTVFQSYALFPHLNVADGRVEQVAAPREVYEEPSTVFVADFLGVSNLMEADAVGGANICRLQVGDFELDATRGKTDARGPVRVTIRPERVRLEPHADGGGQNRIPGMVERLVYLGSSVQVIVHLAVGHTVQALVPKVGEQIPWSQGTPVQVYLPPNALRVLEDTGATLALIDENAVPA